MACQSVRNQDVHELGLRQSTSLPKLRVHADVCEPWYCVRLVDKNLVVAEKEIDTSHCLTAQNGERFDRKLFGARGQCFRHIRRHPEDGALSIEILCVVRVEVVFAVGHNLSEI